MNTLSKAAFTAIMACGLSVPALAGDGQVAIGGEYLFDGNGGELSFPMVTAKGNYFFTENLGIEGEASFGVNDTEVRVFGTPVDFSLDNQFGIYGIGRLPNPNGEAFLRVGLRAGSLGADVSGLGSGDADYTGFSLGAGYTWYVGERSGIRAEITTSGVDLSEDIKPEGNFSSVALSYVYRFGG